MSEKVAMKTQQLVDLYIRLRDRRAQRKKAFENDDAADKGHQEKIEHLLMKQFQEEGTTSVSCDAGTAYTSVKTSATVADWDAIFGFIKEKELWQFLEHRVSKSAVDEYVTEHQELPPGVNMSRAITVNVRRSS